MRARVYASFPMLKKKNSGKGESDAGKGENLSKVFSQIVTGNSKRERRRVRGWECEEGN